MSEYEASEANEEDPPILCDQCNCELTEDEVYNCDCCVDPVCESCVQTCNCNTPRHYCSTECAFAICESCGDTLCANCAHGCSRCECTFCRNCHGNPSGDYCESCQEAIDEEEAEEEVTAENYTYDPKVLDYSTKPEWEFRKNKWENTQYLGVELECNFLRSQENNILDYTTSKECALRDNHIWKTDCSIGSGAELVTAPMTLQIHHKMNWKAILTKLHTLGATSYKGNTCGLHVHVSVPRNWKARDKARANLYRFAARSRSSILKFSQRTREEFNRWASIPDSEKPETWENSRYRAIHFTGQTFEFRFFRGTTFYPRFYASLQFADAAVLFATQCSKLQMDWKGFICWLKTEPRYAFLLKYLKGKRLCA